MASTRDVLACTTKEHSETLSPRGPRREGSVNVPRAQRLLHSSQPATTQDQHHAQGLALCCDVTLDIVTHRWVPAGHPQYTGARKGRLWLAHAQTQLTLFVDPQSLSHKCEHGSGAEGSKQKVQVAGPRTQPELVHQHRPRQDGEKRTVPSSLFVSQMRKRSAVPQGDDVHADQEAQ